MRVAFTVFLLSLFVCSSTYAEENVLLATYLKDSVQKSGKNLSKTNSEMQYLVSRSDFKELKRKFIPSLAILSHKGGQSDFFKSIDIKARLENLRDPTATVEFVAKW